MNALNMPIGDEDDDTDDNSPAPDQEGFGVIARVREGVDLVRDSAPGGGITVHEVNRRQRMIDQLHDHRTSAGDPLPMLSDTEYETANALRNAWEGSGRSGIPSARDLERPFGDGGNPQLTRLSDKFDYLMQHVGRETRHCLVAVVLHDEHPEDYGHRKRCHGVTALQRHLDAMGRPLAHWEAMEERAKETKLRKLKAGR